MAKKNPTHTLGIDIGGTKILAVLLDEKFHIESYIKLKTKPEKGEPYFMHSLEEAVDHLLQESGLHEKDILGAGIGCPGFINPSTGVVLSSANIPFLKNYPLATQIQRRFKLRAVVGNDVQTGLYGEHQLGIARGLQHVIGIFLGTGIGGSIIINGQTYTGASGAAGEVGHVLFDAHGPLCGCGKSGCVEAFAGRLAIASEAAVAATRNRAPYLASLNGTDVRMIKSGLLAKAAAEDRVIADIVRAKARIVGTLMANLVNILNPEMIVLGGGLVEAMPRLIVPEAEQAMRSLAIPASARHVRVKAAKLGDFSVAMGAAKRAWDKFHGR
jgi:glucokinase